MVKKEARATTNRASLAEEIGTATRILNELEAEKVQLPAKIEAAARAADATEMVKLRRRFDEIDIHIHAARTRLLRLKLGQREIELDAAKTEATIAADRVPSLRDKFDEARRAYEEANTTYLVAYENTRGLQMEIGEMKRRLNDLEQEASAPLAPVVRSRPHTPQAA